MDYLQYFISKCYLKFLAFVVLNLIINGLPSIPNLKDGWKLDDIKYVLNLIINGLPSIPYSEAKRTIEKFFKF